MPLPLLTPPDPLISAPHWVGWRAEIKPGDTNPSKIPYNLKNGRRAASDDPNTWLTYDEACNRYIDHYNGIGFVFTKEIGITGIDLDDCIGPDGEIEPWANEILLKFLTYAEISPSGKGIKLWSYGNIPDAGVKICFARDGRRVRDSADPNYDHGIEMYDTGRYFAVTGNLIGDGIETIEPCQGAISELYAWLRSSSKSTIKEEKSSASATTPKTKWPGLSSGPSYTAGSRHTFLKDRAASMRNWLGDEDLRQALHAENKNRCSPPKTDKEVENLVRYFTAKPVGHSYSPEEISAFRRDPHRDQKLPPPDFHNGHAAQVNGFPAAEPEEAPITKQDSLSIAETLLLEVLESGQGHLMYGATDGTPASYLVALAAAGDVAQVRAKGRLKLAFPKEFVPKRWDTELKEQVAILKARHREESRRLSPYILFDNGSIRPILANAITSLEFLDLAYDTFQQRVVLKSPSPWGPAGQWSDDDDLHGTEYLQRHEILVDSLKITNGAARRIALKNPFHPVRDWLSSLVWDGTPRADLWLSTYMGVAETNLTMDFARMWLISAVARIFKPGCKADCMLVMESGQGIKKSSALRVLVNGHLEAGQEPFWFRDRIPTLSSDDVGLHMQGVWVIEIAELDAIRRSAAWTATKNFISDQSDTFRRKYGINLQDYPRQCVFAGSTNEKDWLGDKTGGRRFWPVRVKDVDIDGLKRDREQIWAEAVHLYSQNQKWYLSDEQEDTAREEIESRMPEDVWQEKVNSIVDADEKVRILSGNKNPFSISVSQIMESMKIPIERQDQVTQNRVASSLRSLGFNKFRDSKNEEGIRPWRYKRVVPDDGTPLVKPPVDN